VALKAARKSKLTEGNLVAASETLLAGIVAVDPIHLLFDVDEPTYLRLLAAAAGGRRRRSAIGSSPRRKGVGNTARPRPYSSRIWPIASPGGARVARTRGPGRCRLRA
jgi:hypothetical protein